MTRINRIEFRPSDEADAFVVFEGHEDRPFWNREGIGPCYVFTNLTFAKALKFEEAGTVKRTEYPSSESEYEEYERAAAANHEASCREGVA